MISDLRMGQNPWFTFAFRFARLEGRDLIKIPPVNVASRADLPIEKMLDWLGRRMLGDAVPPPRIRIVPPASRTLK